jgi:hypothetical protein
MTISLTEQLKHTAAGDLSMGERQVCTAFQRLLRAALSGQIGFKDALFGLRAGLCMLREFHYDVEAAAASGSFDPVGKWAEASHDKARSFAPLSALEKAFFEDAEGLIEWATRNGVSFSVVLQIFGHDVSELARDDFQIETTLGPGRFVALKVTGWARRNSDPVGEADEQM